MLISFHAPPTFNPMRWVAADAPIARFLRMIWTALLEGITAHNRFEQMMRRGIPSDRALRRALGISSSESEGEHAPV
jgi:hypothetical protein